MADESYSEIMKIAFQAEEAISEEVIARFGRKYADKTVLIKEGDVQQEIFWILSGEVYITRKMGDKYKVLATLGKGELIGEMSFFDKSVRSATVITKGPVEALVFSKENFQEIYAASPQWTKRLLLSLASRIRVMVERLSGL
jgi:CRP/FNR family cyclic AMP-dependent transcriptional regulator